FPDRAPFYYLLAHGWLMIADPANEALVRLPSALAGIAALPLIYCVGQALGGRAVGLLAAALLAVSEFAIHQAQEARYYSFVLLFTLLAAWFALRARDRGRNTDFLLLTVASVCLVATHYLTLFWLIALWLYLLLRRPWARGAAGTARQWLIWQALTAVGLLPLPLLVALSIRRGRGAPIAWASSPEPWAPLRDAATYLIPPHAPAGAIAGAAFLALVLGVVGVVHWRRGAGAARHPLNTTADTFWLLGFWVACPLLIPCALSWLVTPFYVARYTVPALPAVILLVATGLLALRPLLPLPLTLLVLAVPIVPGLANYYASPSPEDWRAIAARVAADSQPGDLLVFAPREGGSLQQMFDRYGRSRVDRCELDRSLPDDEAITAALDTCIAGHRRVWVILRYNVDNNPWYAANLARYFLVGEPPGLSRRDEEHLTPLHLLLFERSAP
ncbi:MAG TPA: glycosyltransferase family 39 protein, partial [Thermomicrobiales bacterium]